MILTLVRHGETEWNRLQKCQGASDIPLNETGKMQSRRLGEALKGERIDAIFSSGLSRAAETARAIAGHHGLDIGVKSEFREMDQGDFEGAQFSEIREKHSKEMEMWAKDPETFRIPGGESLGEVQARALRGVESLAANWPDGNIVVVTHNLTIISMLCLFTGEPLSVKKFRIDATSKTVVSCSGGGYRITAVNDTSHLDGAQ
ncbi:MAG: histidine phosphatase family protein [Candidatus Dadabacteria bacterium]|nr:histidine phosphatase family protein [Candidatus Dadabacteria bacterium]